MVERQASGRVRRENRRGNSPGQAREILTEPERQLERVMLRIRLAEGRPVAVLGQPAG